MDKDGNGLISADELKNGLVESIEKKIQLLIDEADVDGDRQINFLEFCKVNWVPPSYKDSKCKLPPPKPPDGGWGWVVIVSCFMCNFVIGKSF